METALYIPRAFRAEIRHDSTFIYATLHCRQTLITESHNWIIASKEDIAANLSDVIDELIDPFRVPIKVISFMRSRTVRYKRKGLRPGSTQFITVQVMIEVPKGESPDAFIRRLKTFWEASVWGAAVAKAKAVTPEFVFWMIEKMERHHVDYLNTNTSSLLNSICKIEQNGK